MRAAFLGTPSAAIPSLAALADIADVDLVVTMPDAPRDRSRRPAPPPVKLAAQEFGFEVGQPTDAIGLAEMLRGRGIDVAVVVAYGRILTPEALATTRIGFVNVHFSLLPRWRGAAPVERSILAGDEMTGVSLMLLDEGLDTGPVIAIAETLIEDYETGGSLTARLSYLGAEVLAGTLPEFFAGNRDPAPQIETGATHAHRLTTAEARIDPEDGVELVLRRVRAYNPRPGAWLSVAGSRVKLWAASVAHQSVPGGVIASSPEGPVLGVSDGSVRLDRVQPAGKAVMDGTAWMRGRRDTKIAVDPPADQSI